MTLELESTLGDARGSLTALAADVDANPSDGIRTWSS
jgi:hypothetical protein